jgi:hypothetical protein
MKQKKTLNEAKKISRFCSDNEENIMELINQNLPQGVAKKGECDWPANEDEALKEAIEAKNVVKLKEMSDSEKSNWKMSIRSGNVDQLNVLLETNGLGIGLKSELGKGEGGVVFLGTYEGKKDDVAVKFFRTKFKPGENEVRRGALNEIYAQARAAENGLGPAVYAYGFIKVEKPSSLMPGFAILVMDVIDQKEYIHPADAVDNNGDNYPKFPAHIKFMQAGHTIEGVGSWSPNQIAAISIKTKKLNEQCLLHTGTDFHSDNVFLSKNPEAENVDVKFIDFGMASRQMLGDEVLKAYVCNLLGLPSSGKNPPADALGNLQETLNQFFGRTRN